MPRSRRAPGGPRLKSSAIPRTRYLRLLSTAAPSPAAQHRFDVVRWYEEHGRVVRLAARHFGHSPDTVSRWVRAFALRQMRGLEERSRRPQQVRRPTTPPEQVARIKELRERYPRWGREKLRTLLLREGLEVSAKTIDRTIARLRARGLLHEPPAARKALRARVRAQARPRRPADLVVDRPGFVQLDSQELRFAGKAIFTFAAVDFFTRKRVLGAASQLTSAAGARFLARVQERFPFAVRAVQCHGGHEFRGLFEQAAAAAGIPQFINRPKYPQGKWEAEQAAATTVLSEMS